jgi:hypothetical protein
MAGVAGADIYAEHGMLTDGSRTFSAYRSAFSHLSDRKSDRRLGAHCAQASRSTAGAHINQFGVM